MIFHQPTKLIFGPGEVRKLRSVVEDDLQSHRTLLITDQGLSATGLVKDLTRDHVPLEVFAAVEANPSAQTVNRIGDLARRIEPELIIGLGGGSVLDAAKAAAVLGTNPGLIEDYEGFRRYAAPPLPVLAVPTTCGTGSEVTKGAVITDTQRPFKMSIKGPELFPTAAIVDPDLLLSLPAAVIASTGLDALTHAIEAFTSRPGNLITDMFALQAVKDILRAIEPAYQDIAGNTAARESLMYGSTLAGFAFGNSDVGAVHCLAESIGALFDTPHGVANSIFLPFVMRYNLPACTGKYAALAEAVDLQGESESKRAHKLIELVEEISGKVNIPKFQDLGIDPEAFERIAEYSAQNGSNPSNPREAGVQDYITILQSAASPARP